MGHWPVAGWALLVLLEVGWEGMVCTPHVCCGCCCCCGCWRHRAALLPGCGVAWPVADSAAAAYSGADGTMGDGLCVPPHERVTGKTAIQAVYAVMCCFYLPGLCSTCAQWSIACTVWSVCCAALLPGDSIPPGQAVCCWQDLHLVLLKKLFSFTACDPEGPCWHGVPARHLFLQVVTGRCELCDCVGNRAA